MPVFSAGSRDIGRFMNNSILKIYLLTEYRHYNIWTVINYKLGEIVTPNDIPFVEADQKLGSSLVFVKGRHQH